MRTRCVCVFAGSAEGANPAYREAAALLGYELARRRITLVSGGAGIGLMGAVADAVLEADGQVVGVIPEALMDAELAHRGLTELKVVRSMHERKAEMAALADAFIALPGGLGTLEELLEVATWSQLGIHAKPCGLLNTGGYFDPLLAMLDAAVAESFLASEHRSIILIDEAPSPLLAQLSAWRPTAPKRSPFRSNGAAG